MRVILSVMLRFGWVIFQRLAVSSSACMIWIKLLLSHLHFRRSGLECLTLLDSFLLYLNHISWSSFWIYKRHRLFLAVHANSRVPFALLDTFRFHRNSLRLAIYGKPDFSSWNPHIYSNVLSISYSSGIFDILLLQIDIAVSSIDAKRVLHIIKA